VPGLSVLENRIGGTRAGIAELMPKVVMSDTIATKPDREGNLAIWDQEIRKVPDALAYIDGCEAGQQNIAKKIGDDGLSAISVAYDVPEDVRYAIKDHIIPAATPSSFFVQGYTSMFVMATALHDKTALPKGWLKVAPATIDASNIDAYSAGWDDPETGLRAFFADEIAREKAAVTANEMSPMGEYDTPPM
jgi:ribose transport system substrate-binding protein